MFKRIFIPAVVFLIIILGACSEDKINPEASGTIHGVVVDIETEDSISGVAITTSPATSSLLSDSTGRFLISNVDIGQYAITARKNGYKTETVNISVAEDDTAKFTVALSKSIDTNDPPVLSSAISPVDNSTQQPVSLFLKWKAEDPDVADSITYHVKLFEADFDGLLRETTIKNDTFWYVENLKYESQYFWQVSASDDDETVYSKIYTFKTLVFPDNEFLFARQVNGNYEIFSSDSAGLSLFQLTSNSNHDWYPRFSPNGNFIAYVSFQGLNPQIFVMEPTGKNIRQVTTVPLAGNHNYGFGFCWSANGEELYYSNYQNLYSINIQGYGLKSITKSATNRNFREVEVSPTGNKILVVAQGANIYDQEILLMDIDGKNLDTLVANLPGIVQTPSFSTDGQSVIYTHDVTGYQSTDGRQLNTHIIEINIATRITTDLSLEKTDGTNDTYPRFSPDGARIIFVNGQNTLGSKKSIWIMDRTGDDRKELFKDGEMGDWGW